MTKHDDDAAERAEKRAGPVDDLAMRFRELEEENAGLLFELNRARELVFYYRNLLGERFGFVATPPPGATLSVERQRNPDMEHPDSKRIGSD